MQLHSLNNAILNHVTKTTHAHYYWWIRYLWFYQEITNCQGLLLTNTSSYSISMAKIIKTVVGKTLAIAMKYPCLLQLKCATCKLH